MLFYIRQIIVLYNDNCMPCTYTMRQSTTTSRWALQNSLAAYYEYYVYVLLFNALIRVSVCVCVCELNMTNIANRHNIENVANTLHSLPTRRYRSQTIYMYVFCQHQFSLMPHLRLH